MSTILLLAQIITVPKGGEKRKKEREEQRLRDLLENDREEREKRKRADLYEGNRRRKWR